MKIVHFASILAVVALTTFACSGDDDDSPPGSGASSGDSGAAGESGALGGSSGSSGSSGTAGKSSAGAGGQDESAAGGSGSSGSDDVAAGGATASGGAAGASGLADLGGAADSGATADSGGAAGAADSGGAASAGGETSTDFELIGTWQDNFGGAQVIDETSWNDATIVAYDNATNVVYAQNSANDQYNPSKFTKTVYTEPVNDSFYFCLVVYSADTLAAAQADATLVDASDPDNSGCSGFSWSKANK